MEETVLRYFTIKGLVLCYATRINILEAIHYSLQIGKVGFLNMEPVLPNILQGTVVTIA